MTTSAPENKSTLPSNRTSSNKEGLRVVKKVFLWVAGVLVILTAAAALMARHIQPFLRERAEDMLSSQFQSDVQIADFHITLFPYLALSGRGVVLRHHGRTDVPPLISIEEFSGRASLWSVPASPWHIDNVTLKGLKIQIPPREKREGGGMFGNFKSKREVKIRIDELTSDDAEFDIFPGNPDKPVHQFAIHHLEMHDIGPGHGAPFDAELTNATPPGEIKVKGSFGPWQSDEPRGTPLNASYTFEKADLNVFKGISGILSSEGKFDGVLEKIEVHGQTATPDFSVDTADHPVMLTTEFSATVDGTNGDTLLHPVIAHFLNTTLICTGAIVKPEDKSQHGKEVKLDVVSQGARIEDLLKLVAKPTKALLTGSINLKTKFDLPQRNDTKVLDRLDLDGTFNIPNAQFTDPKVEDKLHDFSQRAQGHPDDAATGDPVSQLKSSFKLRDSVITMKDLTFVITGANVQLDGTYGLRSEDMDFHGKLHMQAKPSQAVTGVKSWMLKPFDGFFRKNGVTEIPIKVTGSRSQPSFGLDLHHDKEKKQ